MIRLSSFNFIDSISLRCNTIVPGDRTLKLSWINPSTAPSHFKTFFAKIQSQCLVHEKRLPDHGTVFILTQNDERERNSRRRKESSRTRRDKTRSHVQLNAKLINLLIELNLSILVKHRNLISAYEPYRFKYLEGMPN